MRSVLGVDLGATHYLTLVRSDEMGVAESRVFANGGLSAPQLVATGGPGRLARLLPMAMSRAGRGGCPAQPARAAGHPATDR